MSGLSPDRNAETLAQAFHEAYERLAPSFGYETRKASAVPWDAVPGQNRRLMVAVVAEVMLPALAEVRQERDEWEAEADRRGWPKETAQEFFRLRAEAPALRAELAVKDEALRRIADAGSGVPGWRALADVARAALASPEQEPRP